jgi:HK97 family phage major capsid protein
MIPTLADLASMNSHALRGAIVEIDDELATLDTDENGELRQLSASDERRLESLLSLRSRCEAHLHMRDAFQKNPTAISTTAVTSGHSVSRDPNQPPLLTRDQSVADWVRRSRPHAADQPPMQFAKIARGLATGNWGGAELEQRAIAESPATAGGHMVPTPVASQVIDKARNASRVIEAGAQTIPMTSQTLKYPRLTTDAPASWRNEAASITDQALVFDAVTFTAQSLAVLVKISWELFEDADPESMRTVENSFAQVLGLELDRAALRGSGSAPEPRGVLNTSGITTTAHGANGTVITNYDWWLDAAGAVLASNFTPTSTLWRRVP